MELKKVVAKDFANDKKIILYIKAVNYIEEMDEKYHIAGRIEAIIEDLERRRGPLQYAGRTIPVYGKDYLASVDWDTHMLVLISDYYWEIYDSLVKSALPDRLTVYRFADTNTSYYECYRERYAKESLRNYMVFYSGEKLAIKVKYNDFTDNTRAFYEYLYRSGITANYKIIWLVKDVAWAKANYELYDDNVIFIPEGYAVAEDAASRELYYHYLCLAKYIFFDKSDTFARLARPDQVRVQLWHGQGYKGRMLPVSFSRRMEYMPVMSEIYRDIHARIFDLSHSQLLVTGIPKQDWIYGTVPERLKTLLKIPKCTKYIFWLPTWRKINWSDSVTIGDNIKDNATNLPLVDTYAELKQLDENLKVQDVCLVIKDHPTSDILKLESTDYSNIVILSNGILADYHIHINQLLNMADALISDYSSVISDYLLLNRPIGLAIEDVAEYGRSIGFVFSPIGDWLPGRLMMDFGSLLEFIAEIAAGIDSSYEKRQRVRAKLCAYDDNHNSARLAEALGIDVNNMKDTTIINIYNGGGYHKINIVTRVVDTMLLTEAA